MGSSLVRDEPKYLHLLAMLFAALGFVFLLNLSRSDQPERHAAVLDQVRELARLDAMIGHSVLRSALGDPGAAADLDIALDDFRAVFGTLRKGPLALAGRYGRGVDEALDAYWQFHMDRAAMLDSLVADEAKRLALVEPFIAPAAKHNRGLVGSYERAYDPVRQQAEFYRRMMIIEALLGLLYVGYFAIRLHNAKRSLRRANVALAKGSAELEQALETAERADLSKTAFLANMSHELRTPMNGVIGMAELLAGTAASERQRSQAEVIVRSAGALLTIINDILDFAKIEAGEVTFDPEPFSLRGAVQDVMQLFAVPSRRKGLSISVRVDPGLPDYFVGDVGRCRQILTNLVGNAVKFTEKGRVLVDIRDAAGLGEAGLLVMVADTGIGIPPDKRELVFEKFRQVDNSTKRRQEGTGLGLAISRMLVERMGGRIGVESRVGEGSIFWFILPLPVHEPVPEGAAPRERRPRLAA